MKQFTFKLLSLTTVLVVGGLMMLTASDPITTTTKPSSTQAPTTTTATTTTKASATTVPPSASSDGTECLLAKSSDNEKLLLTRVNKMKGKKYTWKDKEHMYYFSVCQTAENAKEKSAGFIQINTDTNQTYVIGRLNDVDLEGVENTIRMSYNNGDNYQNACKKTERNAVIYLICVPNLSKEEFEMVEENNLKDTNCAYIFKLRTSAICVENDKTTTTTTAPATTTGTTTSASTTASTGASSSTTPNNNNNKSSSKLGVFSIIMISMSSLFVVYMMVGTLYLRFVNRARGWEQVPHMNLWQAVGGRFADCCNYVCRCGQRQTEVHSYENINDRISDDENLLNM